MYLFRIFSSFLFLVITLSSAAQEELLFPPAIMKREKIKEVLLVHHYNSPPGKTGKDSILYQFDKNGRTVAMFSLLGDTNLKIRVTYEYDSRGLKKRDQYFQPTTKLQRTVVYKYGSDNVLDSTLTQTADSSDRAWCVYTYDTIHHITTQYCHSKLFDTRGESHYNASGQLLEITNFAGDSGSLTRQGSVRYEYDQAGRVTWSIYEMFSDITTKQFVYKGDLLYRKDIIKERRIEEWIECIYRK